MQQIPYQTHHQQYQQSQQYPMQPGTNQYTPHQQTGPMMQSSQYGGTHHQQGMVSKQYPVEIRHLEVCIETNGLYRSRVNQETCRLSLKMGRGDEQKPLMHY